MDTQTTKLIEEMFTLSRLMKDQMAIHSKVGNLTFLQLQTLVFIAKTPTCQMSDIAAKFKIELPSATSSIKTLVNAKLVARKTDPKDRRLVRINLTTSGEKLFKDAIKERTKKMQVFLSHLSTEDKSDLLRILQKMIATIERVYEK